MSYRNLCCRGHSTLFVRTWINGCTPAAKNFWGVISSGCLKWCNQTDRGLPLRIQTFCEVQPADGGASTKTPTSRVSAGTLVTTSVCEGQSIYYVCKKVTFIDPICCTTYILWTPKLTRNVNANVGLNLRKRPQKPSQGDQLITPAQCQIKSAIAKLLVSFRCQVKIREGQSRQLGSVWGQTV